MTSQDSISKILSSIDWDDLGDFPIGWEMNLLEGATSEAQLPGEMSEPLVCFSPNNKEKLRTRPSGSSTGATTERKRKVPNELSEGEGKISTKKVRSSHNVGESSKAPWQPEAEPKGKEEPIEKLIKEKSVLQVLKVLRDRVNRRINMDAKADGFSSMLVMSYAFEKKRFSILPAMVPFMKQIKEKWPERSNLIKIKKAIEGMEDEERRNKEKRVNIGLPTDETKQKLKEIDEDIKRSDEERQKDSEKVKDLQKSFLDEGYSMETKREQLSLAFPFLFSGANAMHTGEHVTVLDIKNFEKELFAKDNNKVDVLDFQGLKEAIDTAKGNIPDYLKHIASEIEKARGSPTDFALKNIEILVCAAVEEMESLAVDKLNPATLLKWGATLNVAKQLNFEVEFAEALLKKNLYACFGHLVSKIG